MAGRGPARVRVRVSAAMCRLRASQNALNRFWTGTDIAAGVLLAELRARPVAPGTPVRDLLGHVATEAWHLNRQGRLKAEYSVADLAEAVAATRAHVCRATLVSFHSAFEHYLDDRVLPLRVGVRWGPLVTALSHPALRGAPVPLRLETILCADLCRIVRNQIIHDGFAAPASRHSGKVRGWPAMARGAAVGAGWPEPAVAAAIDRALDRVIDRAAAGVAAAETAGKVLPIEMFYMLFTFTNLDALAGEIEEALLPGHAPGDGTVTRLAEVSRRPDLWVGARRRDPGVT